MKGEQEKRAGLMQSIVGDSFTANDGREVVPGMQYAEFPKYDHFIDPRWGLRFGHRGQRTHRVPIWEKTTHVSTRM